MILPPWYRTWNAPSTGHIVSLILTSTSVVLFIGPQPLHPWGTRADCTITFTETVEDALQMSIWQSIKLPRLQRTNYGENEKMWIYLLKQLIPYPLLTLMRGLPCVSLYTVTFWETFRDVIVNVNISKLECTQEIMLRIFIALCSNVFAATFVSETAIIISEADSFRSCATCACPSMFSRDCPEGETLGIIGWDLSVSGHFGAHSNNFQAIHVQTTQHEFVLY